MDYLNNRYYDPATARFISVDPLVSVTGSAYGYAGNNPITYSDPSGLYTDTSTLSGIDAATSGQNSTSTYGSYNNVDTVETRNGFGFITNATSIFQGRTNDITDEWRRFHGSAADRAFLFHRNVCQYNEGSCIAAAYLINGGAASGAAGVANAACDQCDHGAVTSAEEVMFVIEFLAMAGSAKLLTASLRIPGALAGMDLSSDAGMVAFGSDGAVMLRENGTQITSKTLTPPNRPYRIDVENPAPGMRPGQLHLQDGSGGKYLYNFGTGEFEGVPASLAKLIARDPAVARAIIKGGAALGVG